MVNLITHWLTWEILKTFPYPRLTLPNKLLLFMVKILVIRIILPVKLMIRTNWLSAFLLSPLNSVHRITYVIETFKCKVWNAKLRNFSYFWMFVRHPERWDGEIYCDILSKSSVEPVTLYAGPLKPKVNTIQRIPFIGTMKKDRAIRG